MVRYRPPINGKRDANEGVIVDALEAHGFTVERMDKPADLLIGRKGRTWIAEVKVRKGDLTPPQRRFYARWTGNKLTLRSAEDVAEFAAETKGNE